MKNELEDSRFGFVVSIKVSKKAVVRNRVKRIMRHAIHENLEKIKSGLDIVFFTRPGIEKLDGIEIRQQVMQLLTKLNLLK